MAKFCGIVGYEEQVETRPNIFEPKIRERKYYGDILRNNKLIENSGNLNDDIKVNCLISIVADAYAYDHFFAIKYVTWQKSKWKVTNVDPSQRHRILLTLGGMYNGPEPEIP